MQVHALTKKYVGISNCIKTPVVLGNTFTRESIGTLAIWDTGATNSVITKSAADSLGLKPISKAVVNGVHGSSEVNVYHINVTLNNNEISINTQVTECSELSADCKTGFLIGMSIISLGDFSITNYGGNTTMSFRVPSQQVIDYVEGMRRSTPLVKDKIPSRNDSCPCGSEKKYKNCCGKE